MTRSGRWKLGRGPTLRLAFVALGCAFVFACSVDEEEHPNWLEDKTACEKRTPRGTWRWYRSFCFQVDAGSSSAGAGADDDSGVSDASAADGGDASLTDSGPIESCPMLGLKEPCYEGPAGTELQQPCKPGEHTCEEGGWGECKNQFVPAKRDSCNGRDDDCDGITDEMAPKPGCQVQQSGVMGACAVGLAICDQGTETCIRYVQPKSETCNGLDDDCDGTTDEGVEVACYTAQVGCTANGSGGYDCVPGSICAPGRLTCTDGDVATECAGQVTPGTEIGTPVGGTAVDEDCDGMTDEDIECIDGQMFQCYTGLAGTRNNAPCQGGTRSCVGTMMEAACNGQVIPQAETCANERIEGSNPNVSTDNDCDGVEDDVPSRNTSCAAQSSAIGACKANARWQCMDGAEICIDGAPSAELCDGNGVDENCDSRIDEGFDLTSDENNCGACGVRCGANQGCCGSVCVNLQTSNAHCGSCTNACSSALSCCAGGCVDTRISAANCGSCGNSCGLLGGVLVSCANSSCKLL